MAKSWYILQTFAGYEQKISKILNEYLEDGTIDSAVLTRVMIPTEEVEVKPKKDEFAPDDGTKKKSAKTRVKQMMLLPGYIMLEMDLPVIGWKDTCTTIRRIKGVGGFVGTEPLEKPRAISSEEARRMLQAAGEIKGEKAAKIKQNYEVGDKVKITEGPFATFPGVVDEVLADKSKLRVTVEIFGRSTPVEIDVGQVEKN